mmetsp:Transcript_40053/g.100749  ORF Transcript_40053/g.100749 Transcript_40053/m.100749 type:complete len:210 (+) Transcript_40053:2-631(+)
MTHTSQQLPICPWSTSFGSMRPTRMTHSSGLSRKCEGRIHIATLPPSPVSRFLGRPPTLLAREVGPGRNDSSTNCTPSLSHNDSSAAASQPSQRARTPAKRALSSFTKSCCCAATCCTHAASGEAACRLLHPHQSMCPTHIGAMAPGYTLSRIWPDFLSRTASPTGVTLLVSLNRYATLNIQSLDAFRKLSWVTPSPAGSCTSKSSPSP